MFGNAGDHARLARAADVGMNSAHRFRLKNLVADLSLEKQVLSDIARENLFSIRGT